MKRATHPWMYDLSAKYELRAVTSTMIEVCVMNVLDSRRSRAKSEQAAFKKLKRRDPGNEGNRRMAQNTHGSSLHLFAAHLDLL